MAEARHPVLCFRLTRSVTCQCGIPRQLDYTLPSLSASPHEHCVRRLGSETFSLSLSIIIMIAQHHKGRLSTSSEGDDSELRADNDPQSIVDVRFIFLGSIF